MNNIREMREKLDMTQEQLARLADLKSGCSHISKLERGHTRPSKRTIRRIAAALNKPPEMVFPDFQKLRRW